MAVTSRLSRAILLLTVISACAGRAGADGAFEALDLELSPLVEIDRNRFHDRWSPGAGGTLAVTTPFHAGRIRLAIEAHPVDPETADVPGFDVVTVTASWRVGGNLHPRLRIEGGPLLGRYGMTFDDDAATGFARTEAELVAGVVLGADLHLLGPVGATVEVSRRVVLTEVAIHQVYVAAGLRARLDTPRWLVKVLR